MTSRAASIRNMRLLFTPFTVLNVQIAARCIGTEQTPGTLSGHYAPQCHARPPCGDRRPSASVLETRAALYADLCSKTSTFVNHSSGRNIVTKLRPQAPLACPGRPACSCRYAHQLRTVNRRHPWRRRHFVFQASVRSCTPLRAAYLMAGLQREPVSVSRAGTMAMLDLVAECFPGAVETREAEDGGTFLAGPALRPW